MQLADSLPQRFADRMGQLLGPDFPASLGLAVSGGGDSMAMLHLAADWARVFGIGLRVVTVDHGLRAESAAEAALVADESRGLGLPHDTLRWTGWDSQGNVQDAARQARRRLIGGWCGPTRHVLFAHTQDDQAETLLMRLARGSGVDGLAAMRAMTHVPAEDSDAPPGGWHILRPLLGVGRADLRHYLQTLRIPFVDDPGNADPAFARVRMRHLIGTEGLSVATLSDTARQMARAAEALGRRAHDMAETLLRPDLTTPGTVVLDRDGFAAVEAETQLRILAGAMQYVASAPYRPRLHALEDAANRVLAGGSATLHGTILLARRDRLYVAREFNAVADAQATLDGATTWDRRWRIAAPDLQGLQVRALGQAGLARIAALPTAHAPRAALTGLPAIWQDDRLIACQPLGHGPAYDAALVPRGGNFPHRLLGH